jgi:hypothetical protein
MSLYEEWESRVEMMLFGTFYKARAASRSIREGQTMVAGEVLLNSRLLPEIGRGIEWGGIEMRPTMGGKGVVTTWSGGDSQRHVVRWLQ